MTTMTTTHHGKKFALVPWAEYRRLSRQVAEEGDSTKSCSPAARRRATRPGEPKPPVGDQALPPWPPVDADGTSNALESARVSIARTLIQDRRAAGLSQQRLSELAGVRQETISRIESGKHTATVRVIDKLDKALRRAKAKINSNRRLAYA